MKGDFTRVTFDPLRHFSRVLMQQGRVQLDADFNEQSAILLYYLRTLVSDLIGPYGGPSGTGAGFLLEQPGRESGRYRVTPGHYYVDGILVENHDPNAELRIDDADGGYVVYLDVWERHVTALQVPGIREVALGGPDTCTRAEVVWALRCERLLSFHGGGSVDCDDTAARVDRLRELERPEARASLRARLSGGGQGDQPCSIPPESRYRGQENQLYRVEVHRGGEPWDGTTDADGAPIGNAEGAATFVWSRDNGSVVAEIVRQAGPVVHLAALAGDEARRLRVGDWVEIMDDDLELAGEPGILAQVDAVDSVDVSVTLKAPAGVTPVWPEYDEESTAHPLLRRWDHVRLPGQAMQGGAMLVPRDEGEWLALEDGIEVVFRAGGEAPYRTGDYWLIPARVPTRVSAGGIDWPRNADGEPELRPPAGVTHHFAPVAAIAAGVPADCRCVFRLPCDPVHRGMIDVDEVRRVRPDAAVRASERTRTTGSTRRRGKAAGSDGDS